MGATGSMMQKQDKPIQNHQVRLAVTPIGPKVLRASQMLCAYHSSVAVDDVEFCFSRVGVSTSMLWLSHQRLHGPALVFTIGTTTIAGINMLKALAPFFTEGTYDLLRKNCNTFSDCALFYLLGHRLDPKYRMMEQVGEVVDSLSLVRMLTLGSYAPNPRADSFRLGEVLTFISHMSEPDVSITTGCYGCEAVATPVNFSRRSLTSLTPLESQQLCGVV